MRARDSIQQGWQVFLRSLANDGKLKFVIGHNVNPATNGKCIWLPELPVTLTPDDLVMFKGDAFHEVGHIKYSNIPYFQAFAKQYGEFGQFLLNALDDVFMEGRMASWKVMAARYLRDSIKILIARGQYRDGSESLGEAVGSFCLTYLTAKRWPELAATTAVVELNLRKHLGEHADVVVPQLVALLDAEFPAVRSTEHGGALALKIMELLKKLADESEDQDETQGNEGEPGDEDESDESDPESKDDGDSKDEGSDDSDDKSSGKGPADDESDDNDGNGSDGKIGDDDGADDNQNGGAAGNASGKSLKEMIDDMLKENLGDTEVFDKSKAIRELSEQIKKGEIEDYKGQPMVESLEIDGAALSGAAKDFVDGMPVVKGDNLMATAIKAATSRKANVMANRLRALLANEEETETYTARSGRLNEKALFRIGLNDTRVFEKSEDQVQDTAAVSITADLSGSTQHVDNGTSIAEQIRVALTMLESVLNEIGTPREILGFAPKTGELNCLVRTFGDNHRVALDRIAGLHALVGGESTPIGEAVMQSGIRLMAHEARRKLMFVVTDGSPTDTNKAVEMTNFVASNGVQVIYLVIGSEQSCEWLKNNAFKYVHASNAEGLIPALVSKVAEFLA